MKVHVLGDRVLIRVDGEKKVSMGGIALPDQSKEPADTGMVVDCGPGKYDKDGALITMNVTVGERVLFHRYSGEVIDLDGWPHRILGQDQILAVFDE